MREQFESSDSNKMALGFCKNCSPTNTTVTMSQQINCKNLDSTDVCPYCRSARSEMDTNLMCSQDFSNINKNSVETHQQLTNSQQYYSRPCVGYIPTECRCAKNNLSTKCSSISRTNYVSSADG
ncbi:unnamed protein product [Orchesella dallaii]|uniref:Uncharacterized protein n=1 Tax=Orchesella dallaii TaxID=48710 RepID=A0ABP1QYZ7_9HEXA